LIAGGDDGHAVERVEVIEQSLECINVNRRAKPKALLMRQCAIRHVVCLALTFTAPIQ
jgi:hypothetical protein